MAKEFGAISLESYRKFLHHSAEARYTKVRKVSRSHDPERIRKARRFVVRTLLELLCCGQKVMYFDTSSVSDLSYRQRAWAVRKNRAILPTGYQLRTFKMLLSTSSEEIHTVQFVQQTSAAKIEAFLATTLQSLQRKWPGEHVHVFLDNSRQHKGEMLASLTARFDVTFFFNVPSSPALNLVENLFEILKRPLRRQFNMRPYSAIDELLTGIKKLRKRDFLLARSRQLTAVRRLVHSVDW